MTVLRRHLLLGTALVPLGRGAQAQRLPMQKAKRMNGSLQAFDLSLTEKSTAPDGTMSVVAEADAGVEVVGLAIDIGPDWKVVNPQMHVLSYTGELRLRSLGPRSDAFVRFIAKAHGLAIATDAMATERRVQVISNFPPGADLVLNAGGRVDRDTSVWMRIDWPHRLFSIGSSDAQHLLDVLTRAA
ncbi:hypothetical protein NU688_15545 [Variovorax sp. ZS18.2.2]|uniref:hypothetical protein n=1 Tax=Variovorax sp. ZS18.2.2 TaxID=2971255 RepID=UPI0021512235|nr:hypothetical protein [Variovorax sp. ZS18.2.2]MCR6477575.1 hypothetical protein [Variovorax sp. ZS18.2.2]